MTDLYRFYDAGERLLYVGISLSAIQRASDHRSTKGWWSDVTRMDVQRHASRDDALIAERDAIRDERPIHNIVHANKETVPRTMNTNDPLVGKFVLTPDIKNGGWPLQQYQCSIEASLGDGFYLIQFYEWGWGEPSNQQIVAINDMIDWRFYATQEDWREAGSAGMRARDRWLDQQERAKP